MSVVRLILIAVAVAALVWAGTTEKQNSHKPGTAEAREREVKDDSKAKKPERPDPQPAEPGRPSDTPPGQGGGADPGKGNEGTPGEDKGDKEKDDKDKDEGNKDNDKDTDQEPNGPKPDKGPKLSRDLDLADPVSTVKVIVQFKGTPSPGLLEKIRQHGGIIRTELGVITGAVLHVRAGEVGALAEDAEVAYISPDRRVKGANALDYAQETTRAAVARQLGYSGQGVAVAVIDSGISHHNDLMTPDFSASRVVYQENFVANETSTADVYGHGTHVAGVIGGNGADSTFTAASRTRYTFLGVAPRVSLVNLRVLDGNGYGMDSWVIQAIDRAIELKDRFNIRVINLSLGRPVQESYTVDPLCQAVVRAWRAGIVVVVAAGNEGRNNCRGEIEVSYPERSRKVRF